MTFEGFVNPALTPQFGMPRPRPAMGNTARKRWAIEKITSFGGMNLTRAVFWVSEISSRFQRRDETNPPPPICVIELYNAKCSFSSACVVIIIRTDFVAIYGM